MPKRLAFAPLLPWRLTARAAPPVVDAPPVPNLRDIASAAPGLARTGALFRGAAPACVPCDSHADAGAFLTRVSRFIDLRTRDERVLDPHDRILELCGADYANRTTSIPLLNRRRVLSGLSRVIPPDQFRELLMQSLWSPKTAKAKIVRRMDQGGLVLLNRIMLEAGGPALVQALRVITRALLKQRDCPDGLHVASPGAVSDRSCFASESDSLLNSASSSRSARLSVANVSQASSNKSILNSRFPQDLKLSVERESRPVYIFCSAGKDRTGMLVALVLSVLGASDDQIIRDYVKSAETWENGPYFLRADYSLKLEHSGLTPKTWLGASADVMERTLAYLTRKFGSAEAYLSQQGFNDLEQSFLRDALQ